MTPDETARVVEQMLSDFSDFSFNLGGLEFYGNSTELRDLLQLCHDIASLRSDAASTRKAYLFIEPHHGKSSLAKATEVEAKRNGFAAYRFDGTVNATQKELRDLQANADAIVVVDGVPEVAENRRILLERFNSLKGRSLLFASPQYQADASLDSSVQKLRLCHIDERPLDKLAWLIGLMRESLRDESGILSKPLADSLLQLPARVLTTLSSVALGTKVREFRTLAEHIAQAFLLRAELDPSQPFPQEELAAIFIEFYSPGTSSADLSFRLWVEGESDSRILKLVSRLAKQDRGADLEEGLSIFPLGVGRGGGTSKAIEIVLSHRTRINKDTFLFDSDDAGRHAEKELRTLDQDVVLLEPRLACSRADTDVEVEDFISLSCLDRFYQTYADLRPEKEIIRYKAPPARRIVVDGAHKDVLISWLESNASIADLENLLFVLCGIRRRFSLKGLLSANEMRAWRKRLEEEFDTAKHFGSRPTHWSEQTLLSNSS